MSKQDRDMEMAGSAFFYDVVRQVERAEALNFAEFHVLKDVNLKVTRGENAGEALRHDHVVSLYQPVAPWSAAQGGSARLTLPAGSTQRVAFVVTNAGLTQPVQALVLPGAPLPGPARPLRPR